MSLPRPSRSFVVVSLCVLAWLAAIDFAVNAAFGSSPPPGTQPSALNRYFEYGRSVEGKLARMVADPDGIGLILRAGWIEPATLAPLPDRPQAGTDLLMGVYGQSFALNASKAAADIDGHITLRGVGGPAAPPNHSYAAYKTDAPLRKADVVVFGVLSSSVAHMGSMSGLIWMFESPAPFTFPRYGLSGDTLTELRPVIGTEREFLSAFASRSAQWEQFKSQLIANDRGYDRFTFDASALDNSAIVRLVRRGWVAHQQTYEQDVYDPATGFRTDAPDVRTLQRLLVDLGQRTRARGERLVVLLMHTRGHSDHLYQALGPTLQQAGIDFISTHTLFSANDPSNFVADGHYVPAANERLARALLEKIARPAGTSRQR